METTMLEQKVKRYIEIRNLMDSLEVEQEELEEYLKENMEDKYEDDLVSISVQTKNSYKLKDKDLKAELENDLDVVKVAIDNKKAFDKYGTEYFDIEFSKSIVRRFKK